MKIRLLNREEVTKIYREKMPDDFAAGEIKPLERILELSEREQYFCYGMFEETPDQETMVGYGFLVPSGERDAVLLDYFAVTDGMRGRGYGSRCFAALKEEIAKKELGNLILEVENPRFGADGKERELRRRRIAFYIRNGMTLTHLRIFLYQVEYLVMISDKGQMKKAADQIYHVYQVLLKPDKIKTRLRISTNIRCVLCMAGGQNASCDVKKDENGILIVNGVGGACGSERLKAFKGFLEKNDIEPEECVVFADSDEDIGLLQYAGIGVTSESAPSAAKNAANYIIRSGKRSGAAEGMEEILQILTRL